MKKQIDMPIYKQPDELTCGPSCLYSVYSYYQSDIAFDHVINEVEMLEEGGTFASNLGQHALEHGFDAKIYSFNLNIFDPTWFKLPQDEVIAKLGEQHKHKAIHSKLVRATHSYINFLKKGGCVTSEDLTANLIRRYLLQSTPIIAGLSATYLYQCMREIPETTAYDDVKGEPSGHFVVLNGIDLSKETVFVSDPYNKNPLSRSHTYEISISRLICAILLGVVTYDANLLIVSPASTI